jgi:protein gp37
MGDLTKIQWSNSTWNAVSGCSQIAGSPGCDNCYAKELAERYKGGAAYPNGFDITLKAHVLVKPLGWSARRCFVNSMSDLFHKDIPYEYLCAIWGIMALSPNVTFQVLTKRPERMRHFLTVHPFSSNQEFLESCMDAATNVLYDAGHERQMERVCKAIATQTAKESLFPKTLEWPLPNVHLGVSVENDLMVHRADVLRDTPAAKRFLSLEPLLGRIETMSMFSNIDWVIIGGESGHNARPLPLDHVVLLVEHLRKQNIATFVKQLGSVWATKHGAEDGHGGNMDEWPPELDCIKIRQFPEEISNKEVLR